MTLGSTTFLHIKHSDLWIVAVTRSNTDASVIFEFLYKFQSLLVQYFGDLTDEVIKDNFSKIYDLLDEILEFGYPQPMDFNNLKQIIPPPKDIVHSGLRPILNSNKSSSKINSHRELSTDIPWRKSDIKYRRNEIFLDVFENINVLISKDGRIIKSYIDGHIDMKTHLSGMPICKFGLNDALSLGEGDESNGDFLAQYDVKNKKAIPKAAAGSVILEDCKFHQCVQLDKFDTDRLINFIPPDGEFELMRYRASENINLPFKLTPMITETGLFKYEFRLNLKSLFPSKLSATDVVVKIPTPPSTIDVSFGSSGGKTKFSTQDGAIFWKFNKFSGLTEHSLTANITVASKSSSSTTTMNSNSRPPITLDFELLMFSSSGVVVRFLKVVEKSNYSTIKWVRYISQGGSYEVRY